jgi:hypothetical protein
MLISTLNCNLPIYIHLEASTINLFFISNQAGFGLPFIDTEVEID